MSNFYLTIDDAPSSYFSQKLNFLDSHKINAMWFCIGEQIPGNEAKLISAIKSGHIVGNHSYSHPHFSAITLDQAKQEITKTDQLVDSLYEQAGIKRTLKVFRFPYGDQGDIKDGQVSIDSERVEHRAALRNFLKETGFMAGPFATSQYDREYIRNKADDPNWGWSYDIEEWAIEHGATYTEAQIKDKLARYLNEYDKSLDQIVLIHDHKKTTSLFPELVSQFIDNGITFNI